MSIEITCDNCGKMHTLRNQNGMGESQCKCGQRYDLAGNRVNPNRPEIDDESEQADPRETERY